MIDQIKRFFPEGLRVVGEYQVRLPTYEYTSKKTLKAVNLNIYRNLHHHSLNIQKQNFHANVKNLLNDIQKANKIWIHYQVFAPTNRLLDTMNVGSIVDKYFSDTLVETGVIEDDNYQHVVFNSFSFGGVCKMDGHAIATIFILEEEKPMRVLLDQNDIQTALNTYVETMGLNGATGVELSINDDEIEAEVTFGESTPEIEEPKPKRKYTRRKKAEPAEEVADESTGSASKGSTDSADRAESAGTEDNSQSGEEKSDAPKGATKKGNLFGEEEDQSSASEEQTPDSTEEAPAPEKVKKKSSIFDVD